MIKYIIMAVFLINLRNVHITYEKQNIIVYITYDT